MAASSMGKLPDKAKVQQVMATFKPNTHEEITSRMVIVVGEQAEVMGSWRDDCEAAEKTKKHHFEVVEYEEKHSFIVGFGQGTKTMLATGSHGNCETLYPYFKPSVAEIFKEYQKTRDAICDDDDLEANQD